MKSNNRYVKQVMKLKAQGRSLAVIAEWWNRMVSECSVNGAVVEFYMPESVPSNGGYKFTGRMVKVLELPVW